LLKHWPSLTLAGFDQTSTVTNVQLLKQMVHACSATCSEKICRRNLSAKASQRDEGRFRSKTVFVAVQNT
jgi:hypothetical protein